MTTKIPAELSSTPGIVDNSDATAITIDSSEQVGIGTATMDGDLHVMEGSAGSVTADGGANIAVFEGNGNKGISILTPDANNAGIFFGSPSDAVGARIVWNYDSNLMSIGPDKSGASFKFTSGDGVERMRIDSGGAVFIAKAAHAFATAGVEFLDSNITNMTNYQNSVLNLHRTSTNGVILEFFKDNGSVGSISTNANSLPSDRNFKRDISNLDLGLDLVTKLQPSQYNYKVDDEDCPKMYGLIAQDLEESLTEVGIEKNSTWLLQHEPKDDENQSEYALDYTKLIPILINSIKELETRIKDLEG